MTNATAENFTVGLSLKAGSRDSGVNDVSSSRVKGSFTDQEKAGAEGSAKPVEAQRDAHLLGRMTEPTEIALAVLWSYSRCAGFVTGRTFLVNGSPPIEFKRWPDTARMATTSG